jgi:hypothetical protein
MMRMRIVSFDPGAVTGVCVFEPDWNYRTNNLNLKDLPNPHDILYGYLLSLRPDIIIYEPFHHRQLQLGAVYTGIEYIGIIKLWAQQEHIPILEISPGTGKGGFWKGPNKLKALGLWNPKAYPHGMDALRIMLAYQDNDPAFSQQISIKLWRAL